MNAPDWYTDLRDDLRRPVSDAVWAGMAGRLAAAALTALLAVPFLALGAWRAAHVIGHRAASELHPAGWYVSGDALRRLAFNAVLAAGLLWLAVRLIRRAHRYLHADLDVWGRVLPRWYTEGRWTYGDPFRHALNDPYVGPTARTIAAKVLAVSAGIVALAVCAIRAVVGAVYHEDQVTPYALVGVGAALIMAGLVFYLGAMERKWGEAIVHACQLQLVPESDAVWRSFLDDAVLYLPVAAASALGHLVAPSLRLWQAATLLTIAWTTRCTIRWVRRRLARRRELVDTVKGAANFAASSGYPAPAAGENFTDYLNRTLAAARSTTEQDNNR